jgi:release factor glutamine methyltransferase
LKFPPGTYLVAVTVLEVIQRSTGFLAKKGVDSPRLQSELLLAHVLQVPRLKLYLSFERTLSEPEADTVRGLVKRRGAREPLQQVVGSTCFCGLDIRVNRHVFVPRPETEALAERAWNCLASLNAPSTAVLDFGTGSGCIAIALAAKCPQVEVHAVDVSPEALRVARENARLNGVDARIQFQAGDGFSAVAAQLFFGLIVSNPPYIATAEIDTLAPEVCEHDPRLALDGGSDGLDFYRKLAVEGHGRLRPNGRLMVEFGDGQEARIREILVQHKWIVEGIQPDYSGRPRILTARR